MNEYERMHLLSFLNDSDQIVAWSGAVLDERLLAAEWDSATSGDALQCLLSNRKENDSNIAWYVTISICYLQPAFSNVVFAEYAMFYVETRCPGFKKILPVAFDYYIPPVVWTFIPAGKSVLNLKDEKKQDKSSDPGEWKSLDSRQLYPQYANSLARFIFLSSIRRTI